MNVSFELFLKGTHLLRPFVGKGSGSNFTGSEGWEPLDF
jgi:hypothetical protein